MRDLINHKTIPDEEVWIYDGIIYIISRQKLTTKFSIDVIYLDAQYDDPLSLADIAMKYPEVVRVVYETWNEGFVYTYGNHNRGTWELTGKTVGFA